jgi:predicted solute-binding protein
MCNMKKLPPLSHTHALPQSLHFARASQRLTPSYVYKIVRECDNFIITRFIAGYLDTTEITDNGSSDAV